MAAILDCDEEQHFPVDYAGPGGHSTALKSPEAYCYATPVEVSEEAKFYHITAHGFATKSGHPRLDGRRAGISDDPTSRHSRTNPPFDAQEQSNREHRLAECIARGVDENGNKKIWNVRDVKNVFTNYRFVNGHGPGSKHALARFVLPTTESDIKDYKTEDEKRAEAEKAKKEGEDKKRGEDMNTVKEDDEKGSDEGDDKEEQEDKSQETSVCSCTSTAVKAAFD
ncbi:hypothetical protein NEOLEDRAFT_487035 [Neolentinus lepideus HHB14362 ss-1]|uniref:Uncharacterized protein n=1 Tax=Neolentinus lepideus HHB14362 ss-1 TaxID=1314782 RepID=A0A165VN92_9AGAM|nr:hypothetical protein NEOLEDRAFT_487035 [Neolentinus lepideus HHB14362 ss-1]